MEGERWKAGGEGSSFLVLGAWCLVLGWVVLALISVYPRERGTRIGLGLLETASLRSPPSAPRPLHPLPLSRLSIPGIPTKVTIPRTCVRTTSKTIILVG
jgi:hypothetical protein